MEGPSFHELTERFNGMFSEPPVPAGAGFKRFKRWEWYWEPRVLPGGRFPEADALLKATTEYSRQQARSRVGRPKNASNWMEVGPTTFEFAGFGGIGRVNCMAFHPSEPLTFWVGTPAGGIWRTTDGGGSWSTTTDELPVLGVSDIAIDPSNPDVLYIATGDAETALVVPSSTKSIGVVKSVDGGETWTATGLTMEVSAQKLIGRLLIHPDDPEVLWAAASDGVWRTTNGGQTWTNMNGGWFIDMELQPGTPNVILASTLSNTGNAQIMRSADGGLTWSTVTAFQGVNRIALGVSPAAPGLVMAVCADTYGLGGLEGVYVSNNGGQSFVQTVDGDCFNNMLIRTNDASGCGGQGVFDLACGISPVNASERWIGGVNLWLTTDAGASWNLNSMWTTNPMHNPDGIPFLHSDKHALMHHPLAPNVVYAASDGGIHVTNNLGATWYDRTPGLGISQMYKVGISATAPDVMLCGLQDNGLKQVDGGEWREIMPGDNMECIIDPEEPQVQYSCALTGLLYRTTDDWANRTLIADNIPGFSAYMQQYGFGPGAWVTPFAMDPQDNQVLYIGFKQLWCSANRGDDWSLVPGLQTGSHLRHVAIAPSDPQMIYASTYDTLFKRTGSDWSAIPVGIITGNPSNAISGIAVSDIDSQRLWVTLSGYDAQRKVYSSDDGGLSWVSMTGTLPNVPVNCIAHEPGTASSLYLGTDIGVFQWLESEGDWEPFDNGLPNVQVNDLEIAPSNGTIVAATFGRGLWRSNLASWVSAPDAVGPEAAFIVAPNPAQHAVTITLRRPQQARMEVLNALGECVSAHAFTGTSAVIDLGQLSPGTYLIRMHGASDAGYAKLMLVR
ncbi:MAG: T9SS type A sorting domain-containing protein [Flavobacteriales bacterium]|nr:T9SS type A sorting domain-containing protein [Flavobacteriales bacterium]